MTRDELERVVLEALGSSVGDDVKCCFGFNIRSSVRVIVDAIIAKCYPTRKHHPVQSDWTVFPSYGGLEIKAGAHDCDVLVIDKGKSHEGQTKFREWAQALDEIAHGLREDGQDSKQGCP